MAASAFTLFRANIDDLSLNDLAGATVKVALVSSASTMDATNTGNSLWATHSANEISDGAGTGYTAGGFALTDSVSTTTNGWKYDSDDPTWTATGADIPAWRYAVMYVVGTLWGKTDPLIGFFTGNTTGPTDIPATTDGSSLTITVPTAGWFTSTQA